MFFSIEQKFPRSRSTRGLIFLRGTRDSAKNETLIISERRAVYTPRYCPLKNDSRSSSYGSVRKKPRRARPKRYIKLADTSRALRCAQNAVARAAQNQPPYLRAVRETKQPRATRRGFADRARHMAGIFPFRKLGSGGFAKLAADTRDSACISDVAKTQNSRRRMARARDGDGGNCSADLRAGWRYDCAQGRTGRFFGAERLEAE